MKNHPEPNRRRLLAAAVALGAVASLPSAFAQTAAARRRLGPLEVFPSAWACSGIPAAPRRR
jgi:hypothetical protein